MTYRRGKDSSDSDSRGSNPLTPASLQFQNVSFPYPGREDSTKRARGKILDTANPLEQQAESYRPGCLSGDYSGNGGGKRD